jgi:hypothetical protein
MRVSETSLHSSLFANRENVFLGILIKHSYSSTLITIWTISVLTER